MTLKQLRYLREIYRHGLHLSHAAQTLYTSQPGVSKQIQLLEEELGVVLFKRKRNRLLSLTQPGKEILRFAERAIKETDNIKNVGEEYKKGMTGNLVIATSHTQARYRLPQMIRQFMRRFPNVRMEFWQGNQLAVFQQVDVGEADLAIGSHPGIDLDDVLMLPCDSLSRYVITRPKHPLLTSRKLSLAMIARYPIITHTFDAAGRWRLAHFFEDKGLKPNIVFRAVDADVCKAYVELGIGIAILTEICFNKSRDRHLRAINAAHLFAPEPIYIGINRREFHRRYLFEFIEMIAPKLTRDRIEGYLREEERDMANVPPAGVDESAYLDKD